MYTSIHVADIADNCIFLLGGVTLGQSEWSNGENIGTNVFRKVVPYMVI